MALDSIRIDFNGAPTQLASPATITTLLAQAGLAGRRVAVECNGAIVPRSLHDTQPLSDGDRVEIVHALGGG